ncbi:MAG: hypothetical protein WD379_01445 [Dehalococcoidia bacterium]
MDAIGFRKLTQAMGATMALLAALALAAGCKSGGGDGDVMRLHEVEVSAEGGRYEVDASDETLAGVVLDVPPGAVSDSMTITMSGSEQEGGSVAELAEAEPELHLAVVGYALDNIDTAAMHPLYGPLFALSSAEFAGPAIAFGPDGAEFGEPISVSMPLSTLGIDDPTTALPMVQSADGSWEVADFSIDEDAGIATAEVAHFSVLKWLQNLVAAPGNLTALWAFDGVSTATAKLPQDTYEKFARGAVCSGQNPAANLTKIPGLPTLLDYLGFEASALSSGQEDTLKTWITDQYQEAGFGAREYNSISLGDIFGKAMELNGGDVFQSLVTAHNVLRDNRESRPVQDMIANYRGDGGDERGARYHMFGMALYSFAYEYFLEKTNIVRDSGQLVIGTEALDPRIVATIEESIVSGDILEDVTEYAVDLQGAALGRQLYRELRNSQTADLVSKYAIDPAACGSAGGGGGWAVFRITNYGSAEGGYLTVAEVGAEKDPPLLSGYPGGGIDPEYRAVLEPLDASATFPTPEEAAKSLCGSLADFFRPALASFILEAYYNGTEVALDSIFESQCSA